MEIVDELEELIFLEEPRIVVAEWIPFGRNQVLSLTDDLEAVKEVKESLYTSRVDSTPQVHTFATGPVLTKVRIVEHESASFIRFHSRVYYPETVRQVEEFGVHVDWTGRVLYGLALEQVERRRRRQSLDHLSRVVADIVLDSSTMIETVLSVFQRDILDAVFFQNPRERDKFVAIVAEGISPKHPSPEAFLEDRRLKGEINQIVEDAYRAADLGDGDSAFIGTHGLILVSPKPARYEEVVALASAVRALELFQRSVHTRVWALWDLMRETRRITIDVSELDIQRVSEAQHALARMTDQALALQECLRYMEEAAEALGSERERLGGAAGPRGGGDGPSRLAELMGLEELVGTLAHRTRSLQRTLDGLEKEVRGVKDLATSIGERQMRRLNENLQENIVQMETMSRASQRTGVAINMLQLILAGSLAFDILKTLSGEYEVPVFSEMARDVREFPLIWLGLACVLWIGLASVFFNIIRPIEKRREKGLHARARLNVPYDPKALEAFLEKREVLALECTWDVHHHVYRRAWSEGGEGWRNNEVTIQADYDGLTKTFRDLVVSIAAPQFIDEDDAIHIALLELVEAGVLEPSALGAFGMGAKA